MSNIVISLLMGVGVGAWVYGKAARATGGNKSTSIIATVFCGGLVFLVLFMTLSAFSK